MRVTSLLLAAVAIGVTSALTTAIPHRSTSAVCSPRTIHTTSISIRRISTTITSVTTQVVTRTRATTTVVSTRFTTVRSTTTIVSTKPTRVSTSCPSLVLTTTRRITQTLPAQVITTTSLVIRSPSSRPATTVVVTLTTSRPASTVYLTQTTSRVSTIYATQTATRTTSKPASTIHVTQTISRPASTIYVTLDPVTQTEVQPGRTSTLEITQIETVVSVSTVPGINVTREAEASTVYVTVNGGIIQTEVQSPSISTVEIIRTETLTSLLTGFNVTAPSEPASTIYITRDPTDVPISTVEVVRTETLTSLIAGFNVTAPGEAASTIYVTRDPTDEPVSTVLLTPEPVTTTIIQVQSPSTVEVVQTKTLTSLVPGFNITGPTLPASTVYITTEPSATSHCSNSTLFITQEPIVTTVTERLDASTVEIVRTETLTSRLQGFNVTVTQQPAVITEPASIRTVTSTKLSTVSCVVTTCSAVPTITNGDFERGLFVPLDLDESGCVSDDGVESSVVHGGDYALGFQTRCDSSVSFSQTVDLCPSQRYRLSAWIISYGQGINHDNEGTCTVQFCADGNCGAATNVDTANFTEQRFIFVANATQTTSNVQFLISCPEGEDTDNNGAFYQNYLDDFTITPEPVCG